MVEATETDVVIIGAGAAGLACAACLKRAGLRTELLEGADQVGDAWRGRYDRLHLHTSKSLSTLPDLDFAADVPRYPSRDQVVSYLQAYSDAHGLSPRFGRKVTALASEPDGRWSIRCDNGEQFRAAQVVVATGYARVPVLPRWPGLDAFGGPVLHSASYRNGRSFAGRSVLVVGIGNSGGEIALDLMEHGAHPAISVRSPVNVVPRDFMGIPILAWSIVLGLLPLWLADGIGKLVSWLSFGSLKRLGLRRLPYGPLGQIRSTGRIPLLDVGTMRGIREGRIGVVPGVVSLAPGHLRFSDGSTRAFDALVLATGFKPGLDEFLPRSAPLDQGAPRQSGAEIMPGLYVCGFYVSPTGMLREIGREARRIAEAIARRHGTVGGARKADIGKS
ncbi:MAG: NAD(P)/FAD-dependent oxidoreductase [Myxococcales bacterium]